MIWVLDISFSWSSRYTGHQYCMIVKQDLRPRIGLRLRVAVQEWGEMKRMREWGSWVAYLVTSIGRSSFQKRSSIDFIQNPIVIWYPVGVVTRRVIYLAQSVRPLPAAAGCHISQSLSNISITLMFQTLNLVTTSRHRNKQFPKPYRCAVPMSSAAPLTRCGAHIFPEQDRINKSPLQ